MSQLSPEVARTASHSRQHVGSEVERVLRPLAPGLIRVGSRRWFLQTGLAGLAGLSLPQLLKLQAAENRPNRSVKSVILFWLSGGPSQIDMWDPKPDAPKEIRGPYSPIATRIPGVQFSEHLPLQAAMADKLTVLRSIDCSASNHTPITMQAGNPLARRTDNGRDGDGYPSMGSIAARFRGSNKPPMPAFVALADSLKADVYGSGYLGPEFEPVSGVELPGKLALTDSLKVEHLQDRAALRQEFDRMRRGVDIRGTMDHVDRYGQMAYDMVTSDAVRSAFDLAREPDKLRDAYGRESVGEKALLARRLVEAGTTFVTVSGRWGYFDHHGDNVPPWGGIQKGLTPILPTVDRALTTLISDLESRGLLDSTLVLMLGEFGRSPVMTQDAGRNHWTAIMSMVMAGGGLSHGRVIGASDRTGGVIASRKVTPSDLAATVFRHLEIPLHTDWLNPQGRPIPIVTEGGRPIDELWS